MYVFALLPLIYVAAQSFHLDAALSEGFSGIVWLPSVDLV
jgi:hypothetical protein